MKPVAKVDNSSPERKIVLRKMFTPKDAVVLDCFCGRGIIYHSCYENVAKEYFGLDKEKYHTEGICEIADNQKWIRQNDVSRFTVFDLDDYGVPWLLLIALLKRTKQPELTVFVTDGSLLHFNLTGAVTRLTSATERLPKKFNIPSIGRYYNDIILTMFTRFESDYGYRVEKCVMLPNINNTVRYLCLKMRHVDAVSSLPEPVVKPKKAKK